MTMCDGEVIYQDGKFTKATVRGAEGLHDDLAKALSDTRSSGGNSPRAVAACRRFYADYIDTRSTSPSTAQLAGLGPGARRSLTESKRALSCGSVLGIERLVDIAWKYVAQRRQKSAAVCYGGCP